MLRTEMRNENTMHIDNMSALEIAQVMNRENMNSVMAVEAALPQVALAIEAAAKAIGNGGKMLYIGAGTSGRLGIQDAAECPPTFGVEDWVVQGIIAVYSRPVKMQRTSMKTAFGMWKAFCSPVTYWLASLLPAAHSMWLVLWKQPRSWAV